MIDFIQDYGLIQCMYSNIQERGVRPGKGGIGRTMLHLSVLGLLYND